ncbi:MAG TPA: bifunctional glutamate N-acetyltransferase/amino-acid acetyltransferase ArgJ [Verrucomicrobiae bacterium]|nr:bifunctional glutamate N-acetyltransferase/amino-acid acetyltransferase ArgJ [Verrucomicrobiae bacterium]
MPVNLTAPESLLPIAGARLGVAEGAIKKPGRKDVLVIALAEGTQVAGVFTKNAFAAAPVQLCRQRLKKTSRVRALLVNSGNANAATGAEGLASAKATTASVASALGIAPESVLPFSTGVIGQQLPVDRMNAAVGHATKRLVEDAWLAAAQAIMTTDTVAKGQSRQVETRAGTVSVTGIAKGVGMLCPDMATMLAFVGTDAKLSASDARRVLRDAVATSFNCATVDGDTSTNDSCVLFATGQVATGPRDVKAIAGAIRDVCEHLAQSVVRDGEGATRFVTLRVGGARSVSEARAVAYAIAHSPLVKTALFAGDANWGRLAMAIGKAGVKGLAASKVSIRLDEVKVLQRGQPHPDYRDAQGAAVLAKPEFTIGVELGRGKASARIWTCDFSYDYVKINAEYRT